MDSIDKAKLFTIQMSAFEILKKWKSKSPENVDLKMLIHCFDVMYNYQILCELEVDDIKNQMSDMMKRKNEIILKLKTHSHE